jgi:hypothetical protein
MNWAFFTRQRKCRDFKHDSDLLYVQVTVHRDKLRIKQPTKCVKYPTFILSKTLHVSGIFCVHHNELSIVNSAIGTFHAGYVTTYWQRQVGTPFQPVSARKWTPLHLAILFLHYGQTGPKFDYVRLN